MNSSSMKLTSMHGEFWSLLTSEVARLTKRQTFIAFIVMKYLVCKPLLFKLPLMQISKVITLQIVKAFCSRAALANSLICFSSVAFTPGSFYRNRCLRLGVLNNNSNCFKRAYQIWLIMTAYSCKIFFFFFIIILNLHLVPRSAACSACRRKNPLRPEVNLSCGRRRREDADAAREKIFFSEPWRVFVVRFPRDKDL